LRHNGHPYSGINVLLLWSQALAHGFSASMWMTYRQARALGGQVRRGETGSMVVYANRVTRPEQDENGEESERAVAFMKAYTVFNVEQVEGLPEEYRGIASARLEPAARADHAERFFAFTGADIRHGGDHAYYRLESDHVQMPPFEWFGDADAYYATLGHEVTHWTRHPGRLDRDFGRKRWGDAGYACEELVAELGAAFLCADLGLTPDVREDHASYIASWLEVLKNDKRLVFTAAAHAQRAVDYLHKLQPAAVTG
jgi:antirestriction protein ArdC